MIGGVKPQLTKGSVPFLEHFAWLYSGCLRHQKINMSQEAFYAWEKIVVR